MRITSSISRRRQLLLASLLLSCGAYAEQLVEVTSFPDSNYQVSTQCDDNGKGAQQTCKIYLAGGAEKRKIIENPFPPSSIALKDGIFVLLFPCGTQCSATYFYSLKAGLSGPFPLVTDYDLHRGIALWVSKNSIQIYRLFQKKDKYLAGTITLDLPQGEKFDPTSVIDAHINGDSILVEYINRRNERATISRPLPR